MVIEFLKVDLAYRLGSPWNVSQKKIAPHAACMGNKEFKSIILSTNKEK